MNENDKEKKNSFLSTVRNNSDEKLLIEILIICDTIRTEIK